MNQSITPYSLKPLVRPNKNFVYNGKKYPIDFRLIKNNSNYFFSKRNEYKEIHDIVLLLEPIDISEDSIRCFISSCHNDDFDINESNVFSLYQLSIRYEVPHLYSLTDNYIKQHAKSLVFRSIEYKTMLQKEKANDTTTTISFESDEESIASNFFDYINDEKLLELPIPILYRILNNPKLNFNELNETNKNQLTDFLFKCLNKHKKPASVLFLNLDLENQRIEIFSKLINEYSGIFDFSMINSKFLLKTTTDLLSELSDLKQSYSKCISDFKKLFDEVKNERQKQQDLLDSFKQFSQDQIAKEKEKLTQTIESIKQQFSEEKQKQQDSIESFKKISQDQIAKEKEKMTQTIENIKKQFSEEKQKQHDSIESFKKMSQEQITKEQEKMAQTIENTKKQFTDEQQKYKNECSKNINEMKDSIDQNNKQINTFVTKDILILYFDLVLSIHILSGFI